MTILDTHSPIGLSLGGFRFDRQGQRLILRSPAGAASTDLEGFLRGAKHLLKMDFDLEGSAEVDVKAGEFLLIPAGVAHKPVCSDDVVVLIMETVNPYTTFDA